VRSFAADVPALFAYAVSSLKKLLHVFPVNLTALVVAAHDGGVIGNGNLGFQRFWQSKCRTIGDKRIVDFYVRHRTYLHSTRISSHTHHNTHPITAPDTIAEHPIAAKAIQP
jgi:hypothetical protein